MVMRRKRMVGRLGPALTQQGSMWRNGNRTMQGCTGAPAAKAPGLKVMSVLLLVVVASGKSRVCGQGSELLARVSMACLTFARESGSFRSTRMF